MGDAPQQDSSSAPPPIGRERSTSFKTHKEATERVRRPSSQTQVRRMLCSSRALVVTSGADCRVPCMTYLWCHPGHGKVLFQGLGLLPMAILPIDHERVYIALNGRKTLELIPDLAKTSKMSFELFDAILRALFVCGPCPPPLYCLCDDVLTSCLTHNVSNPVIRWP